MDKNEYIQYNNFWLKFDNKIIEINNDFQKLPETTKQAILEEKDRIVNQLLKKALFNNIYNKN